MSIWVSKVDGVDKVMADHINRLQLEKLDADGTQTLAKLTVNSFDQVNCIGDSITEIPTYPARLQTLLGTVHWVVNNLGAGGETSAMIRERFARQVVDAGDCKYVVILAGVNSVLHNISAVDIEADLQAMYTAAHAAGIKVVGCTILPCKGYVAAYGWDGTKQIVLDAVNAWIPGASDIDYVYNGYSALEDPGNPDTLLAVYDSGDHLHPSAAGLTALADGIYASVTWLYSSTTSSLSLSNDPIRLNQSLRTVDDPYFRTVNGLPFWAVGKNIAIGAYALNANLADNCTVLGWQAGVQNTTGIITAFGSNAGLVNTTGDLAAFGYGAAAGNETGIVTAIGNRAAAACVDGAVTAIGYRAGFWSVDAIVTAVGHEAAYYNTHGSITAVGYAAGYANLTGKVTAVGQFAAASSQAVDVTCIGHKAGMGNLSGKITAFGHQALFTNTTGDDNVAVGYDAGYNNDTGGANVFLGANSGLSCVSGSGNVFLGNQAGGFETGSNKLFIDNVHRIDEADGRVKSLIYGGFATLTSDQWLTVNANFGIGTSVFGTNADSVLAMTHAFPPASSPADCFQMYCADSGGTGGKASPHFRCEDGTIIDLLAISGFASTHALLSATHSDTVAGAVVRGDIITGQGVPANWTRLAKGTSGYFLKSDANDAAWAPHGLTYADVGAAAVGHDHAGVYEPVISTGTSAQYWRGDKSWQTLNQAAVAGLTTTDTPTFVTLKLSGLSAGYVPFRGTLSGIELVTNGGFDSGVGSWTPNRCTIASVAGGQSGNCLEMTVTTPPYQFVVQTIAGLTVGESYTFSAYIKSGTAGAVPCWIEAYCPATSQDNVASGTSSGSWVKYSVTFIANGTSYDFYLWKNDSTGGTILFDTASAQKADTKLVDSGLFYDGANVGINDAAPAERLDVNGNINVTGVYKVADVQVVGARIIDARCDDAINSGDATTDGVIDALRDAMISHGLIAAA